MRRNELELQRGTVSAALLAANKRVVRNVSSSRSHTSSPPAPSAAHSNHASQTHRPTLLPRLHPLLHPLKATHGHKILLPNPDRAAGPREPLAALRRHDPPAREAHRRLHGLFGRGGRAAVCVLRRRGELCTFVVFCFRHVSIPSCSCALVPITLHYITLHLPLAVVSSSLRGSFWGSASKEASRSAKRAVFYSRFNPEPNG